jgi:hypothetical protein
MQWETKKGKEHVTQERLLLQMVLEFLIVLGIFANNHFMYKP